MKVLVIGSGGREHALAWGLARSSSVERVICAPGNPGMKSLGDVARVDVTTPGDVLEIARRFDADLVVIGPEAPLVAGAGGELRRAGFAVFGPDRPAAHVEGSKAFAKELMQSAGIPTGRSQLFTDLDEAVAALDGFGAPYVIKADGLAAGKGVVVTEDKDAAVAALKERLVDGAFGDAGARVLIEEYLDGPEASLIAFTDGTNVVACEPAQDFKRVADGDLGPNTGGMGSYSPVPACPPETADQVTTEILKPMVQELAARGTPFIGALYAGVALTSKGPQVIEFNARFGDPETQALIPRLESDLGDVCMAAATGQLEGVKLEWSQRSCVSVVMSSGGYPGDYPTGVEITGLDDAEAIDGVTVFHAGTKSEGSKVVTAGGRVLAVSALGDDIEAARTNAYEAVGKIHFEGSHHRTDIAAQAASSGKVT